MEFIEPLLIWLASCFPFFIPLIIPVGSYGFYKHAARHTDGTDDIQDATTEQKGLMTVAQGIKVDKLEHIGSVKPSSAQWVWLGGFDPTCLVRAYLSANQLNLVDSTPTKILLNVESFDIGGDFDVANSRFVAPITGYYQVNAGILFSNTIVDKRYVIQVYVNGVPYVQGNVNCSLAGYLGAVVSDVIYVVAGQYVELYVISFSGDNTVDVIGGATNTFLSIHFLAEG